MFGQITLVNWQPQQILQQYDDNFFARVNDDIETLTEHFNSNGQKIHEITKEEVKKCVLSFKNGKASDELDLTVEHLKYGGEIVICILTKIVNMVFSDTAIPDSLKGGIGCPIYKNGGKPKDDPNSYRRRGGSPVRAP